MDGKLKKEIWEQSKEWIDAIGQVVNEMASKLGVASEHVYKVYTKQMFYEGAVEVGSSILFTIFWFVMTLLAYNRVTKYRLEEESRERRDESWIAILFSLGIILWIIFMIVFGTQLHDIKEGSMMMFNPEYYTMKDLLESVKALIAEE